MMKVRSTLFALVFLSLLYLSSTAGIQCNVADCQSCSSINFCGLCNTNFLLQLNSTSGATYCQSVTCPLNCNLCYQNNICQVCAGTFFLNATGQCVSTQSGNNTIPSNCLYGTNNSTCNLCAYGYNLQPDGFCYPLIVNILAADNCLVMLNSMSCQICKSGYIVNGFGACQFNPNNVTCNVPNCLFCSTQNNCFICAEGYQPINGACVALPCSIAGCEICADSSNCKQCLPGYIAESSTSCELPGFGCTIPNCQQCISAQSCGQCAIGYDLVPVTIGGESYNMCNKIICPYNMTNCVQCVRNVKSTYNFNNIVCMQCNTGYLLTNGFCFANLTNNASLNSSYKNPVCTGVSSCASCSFNYFCQTCNPGSMLTVQGTCQTTYCEVSNCQSCYITNYCAVCNAGYALVPIFFDQLKIKLAVCLPISTTITCNLVGCSACLTNNNCSICMTGYTINTTDSTCMPNCPVTNCWQCASTTNCATCNPGFTLKNNACNAITPVCANCASASCNFNIITGLAQCSMCNPGFILYQGMCYNQACNIFGCQSCATWMSPPTCLKCNQGLILSPGALQGVLSQGYCIKIPCNIANCANCLASDSCLACNQGFYLQQANNQYTCVDASTIQSCNVINCLQCASTSNTQCMTCAEPYIEYNGNCVCKFQNCLQCNLNRQFCNSCPAPLVATYLNPNCIPAPNQANTCQVPSCTYCLTPWRCSICAQGFTINVLSATNTTCVQNTCSNMPNCLSCDLTGAFCFLCTKNYQQNDFGSCQQITNVNVNGTNSTNYECNIDGCLICNPSNLDQCQKCIPTYMLMGSSCTPISCTVPNCLLCLSANTCTVCNIGYYLNTNLVCVVKNATSQVTCNPNITNCFACVQNGSNSKSQMCVLCNFGFQLNPTTFKCVPMKGTIPNCKIETTSQMGLPICYFCQQGYYLNSYLQCVQYNPTITEVTCDTYNCAYCPMDNYCSYCFSPWNNTNGTCVSSTNCNTGCATCTSSSNCLSCITNFTLQNNACVSCNIPYCAACNPPGKCSSCMGTFNLTNNKCVCPQTYAIINGICQCPSGFIANNGVCILCNISGCAQCSQANKCSQCMASYNITNLNTCIFCNIASCTQCSNNNYCSSCTGSLVVSSNGNSCITCTVPSCILCSSNNNCVSCDNGLILLGGNCITCNLQNCLTCIGNNFCSSCASGYSLNTVAGNCFLCLYPCATCNNDGTCATCQSPFSTFPNVTSNGATCYQCGISNCLTCSSSNPSSCSQCVSNYAFVNGVCQYVCANLNCLTCSTTNNAICTQCNTGYYVTSTNSCTQCPDAPSCTSCDTTNPSTCLTCASGYYLNSAKQCSPCQSFCAVCTSATVCTQLLNNNGQSLVTVNGQTFLAVCNQGCQQCSQNNVQNCIVCSPGYYLSSGQCLPCSSSCKTCNGAPSNACRSCYANTFLSTTLSASSCISCNSNCLTCVGAANPSNCTSCNYGSYLDTSTATCVSGCPFNCLSCSNANTCTKCQTGSTLFLNGTAIQCVLCVSSCRQCATGQPSLCLACGNGFYLSGGSCISCSANCQSCNALGCSSCAVGYYLNSAMCAPNCILPCSTCSTSSATSCRSCIAGYIYSNTSFTCIPQTNCSGACSVCPLGYNLASGSCQQCANGCSSCATGQSAVCSSCLSGFYLSGTQCSVCLSSCATCAFSTGCTTCAMGYTTLASAAQTSNMQCIACESPCLTCQFGPTQCIACVKGFSLMGWKCTKTFYFSFSLNLTTSIPSFNTNYLTFLQALSTSFGAPNIDSLTLNSIVPGSVILAGAASPVADSGSLQSTSQFTGFSNAIAANGMIAGMQIASSSVQVVGGSLSKPGTSNLGLILGICIPVGVLLIVGISLYVYCKKKRSSDIIQKKIKEDSGLTVRETFELSNMQYTDDTGRRIQAL